MDWFVPFSVQLSSAVSMPAGSGTAATHSENCQDVILIRAVIRSWYTNLLQAENWHWRSDSRSRTRSWHCVTHPGQRPAKISAVLLTSVSHHLKWFYCTVKVIHVREHAAAVTQVTQITFALWFVHDLRTYCRQRPDAEDVILVHVLCWKWAVSLAQPGQRRWFTFSNGTAKISAVLLTSM